MMRRESYLEEARRCDRRLRVLPDPRLQDAVVRERNDWLELAERPRAAMAEPRSVQPVARRA